MLSVFVFTSTSNNPSPFRNHVEEVFAFAALRATCLLATGYGWSVLFEAMPTNATILRFHDVAVLTTCSAFPDAQKNLFRDPSRHSTVLELGFGQVSWPGRRKETLQS